MLSTMANNDCRIEYQGDPMAYAVALVAAGVLSIDDEGRVWRHRIWNHGRWLEVTPRRAENIGGKGYLRVSLHVPKLGLVQTMAHRLVYTCKVGPIHEGLQINHLDLDKQNNRPANLETVTSAENIRHSYSNGRSAPWHKATSWRGRPRANTPENRARAQAMRAAGASLKDIGEVLGVGTSHAWRLCNEQHG
jgi:hypothetical protein